MVKDLPGLNCLQVPLILCDLQLLRTLLLLVNQTQTLVHIITNAKTIQNSFFFLW